jgi:hypothetical protein
MALAVVIAAVWLAKLATCSMDALPRHEGDNPQQFHLWTTGSTFSYSFTYDPRKTDHWRFRTDGGMKILTANEP